MLRGAVRAGIIRVLIISGAVLTEKKEKRYRIACRKISRRNANIAVVAT
jgi:hypothetical protein